MCGQHTPTLCIFAVKELSRLPHVRKSVIPFGLKDGEMKAPLPRSEACSGAFLIFSTIGNISEKACLDYSPVLVRCNRNLTSLCLSSSTRSRNTEHRARRRFRVSRPRDTSRLVRHFLGFLIDYGECLLALHFTFTLRIDVLSNIVVREILCYYVVGKKNLASYCVPKSSSLGHDSKLNIFHRNLSIVCRANLLIKNDPCPPL